MIAATKEQFLAALRPGDFGAILGKNLFATLQNLRRTRFSEGPLRASHSFYVNAPPAITEADGPFISRATVIKNIGDATKCWIFRYVPLTAEQLGKMNAAADMAVKTGGHYSLGGIAQFGWQYVLSLFGVKREVKDESGVFCSEFDDDEAMAGCIPFVPSQHAWAVDPSLMLNWLMSAEANSLGWILAASYDGAGNYFIAG